MDAVGGAAVACIGNGHPVVREAIKEQVDKLACKWPSISGDMNTGFTRSAARLDVYNMQLSNEPAEELARILIDSGKGAFELCGFFAGGACSCSSRKFLVQDSTTHSFRFRGNGGRHQACSSGQYLLSGFR
jgi:adenosylmethionine-8-amino-7-oxononanoate aminotransferase